MVYPNNYSPNLLHSFSKQMMGMGLPCTNLSGEYFNANVMHSKCQFVHSKHNMTDERVPLARNYIEAEASPFLVIKQAGMCQLCQDPSEQIM